MKPIVSLTLVPAAFALGLTALPGPADACGGTFCDSGPAAMPVDQTGENVLFVVDGDSTEAHIQIQYDPTTEADKFAWVIPLQAVPEFSVGSDQLFQNLLNGSVPAYGFTNTFEECNEGGLLGDNDAAPGGGGGAPEDDSGGGDGGPDVVFSDTVGAFDIVVLSGGTAAEVMDWLNTEGYQQDPDAEPILEEYLDEGFLFAAFKLTNGADTAEIHPVVLTFDNAEACVPLRLTRIAAQDDMDVRTFFLSNARVVPQNYRHVLVNPLKIDWLNQATNYKDVITAAVDAESADGRAFVTEYAGPSNVIQQFGLYDERWDSGMFATIDPTLVIDELQIQGMLYCDPMGSFCEYYHTLIQGILQQFLPRPAGVPEEEFYGCLECYMDQIDMDAWNADEFANAIQERVIDPGMHALELLEKWPYLSRLYTTISPHEMTEDPLFHENPDLQDVANLRMGENRTLCSDDALFILPDGREVFIPEGEAWPAFQDEMPWEEDIEAIMPAGAPMAVVDNTELIDELLAEYNADHGWPRSGCNCSVDGSGGGWLALGGLFVLGAVRRRRT